MRRPAPKLAKRLAALLAIVVCCTLPAIQNSGHATIPGSAEHVVAVSLDGLNTTAITQLGRAGTPNLHRLMDEGMSTLNARTAAEKTVTLPNHAGMLTGRRVKASMGGHGVTINGYSSAGVTVHTLAGQRVDSVFTVLDDAGLRSALFTSKDKFDLFERSWRGEMDRFTYESDNERLVDQAVASLTTNPHDFTFVHLSAPDDAGHRHSWMSPNYLTSVRLVDQLVGELIAAIEGNPDLADSTALVVTADHGGPPGERGHNSRSTLANYRIPFFVWGAGVGVGDLYDRNPSFREPGTAIINYRGSQPVRNANVANLALEMLGLDAVPGSGIDPGQTLVVDGPDVGADPPPPDECGVLIPGATA
ncbi:alkaline phosphatase family protein [Nocardioides coralli]|uniref:alkaline phosphatase family protein n=1 Tax=Nocardioides coralli TaxID=2872154 RepID=UPI001CA3CB0B|nr:alkaline phosphatase [Nocardioides coralli]QZY28374.1 alkaline phosphatase [Nocardioides coralli]